MSAMKTLGYAAFFVAAVVVSLYLTFPWNAAKERALALASEQTGVQIEADQLDPSWGTGIVARGVRIRTKPEENPIELPEVAARVHLLPLLSGGRGLSVQVPIAQGEIDAEIVQSNDLLTIEGEASGIELALLDGLADATGLPLGGRLSINMDIELGVKDPKQTSGNLKLVGEDLEILKGGKSPELAIGNLNWTIPVNDGVAKLDNLQVKGPDAEIVLNGEITLDKVPKRSRLNLTIKYKPTDALLKRHPILNAMHLSKSAVKRSKGSDGFYQCELRGPASRINQCRPVAAR